ncbi:MAG: hypothetical protein BKP49_00110 [Treponema sp. CETP13]|nr:MAG: hypothetical protein BKP49_00110 [Treponema sp. CETP13]
MLLLLPCATAFYISIDNKKGEIKNIYSATLFGLIAGILYSFLDVLFTSDYYIAKYSIFSNLLHFGFIEMLIPIIIITSLYFVFIKSYDEMFKALFYVFLAFFAVYMPVRIISRNENIHYFLLFFKPTLFLLSILYCRKIIFRIYNKLKTCKMSFKSLGIPIVLMIIVLLVPATAESMWLIGFSTWSWMVLFFVYLASYIILEIILHKVFVTKID